MSSIAMRRRPVITPVLILMTVLVAGAMGMICLYAPTEVSMGHAQRLVYVHVAVAWTGLWAFLLMAGSGVAYLARRRLRWDAWFQAAGEVGWLTSGLTLATGSLWAHEAWGTWWEWEPRLTASFILWLVYSGILLVRSSLEDAHQRARIGAVLAVLGALDLPLVIMATRWFRGMHPPSPDMDPAMRLTLLASVVAFSAVFVWLTARRRTQILIRQDLEEMNKVSGEW